MSLLNLLLRASVPPVVEPAPPGNGPAPLGDEPVLAKAPLWPQGQELLLPEKHPMYPRLNPLLLFRPAVPRSALRNLQTAFCPVPAATDLWCEYLPPCPLLRTLALTLVAVIFSAFHAEYVFTTARINSRQGGARTSCEAPRGRAVYVELDRQQILRADRGSKDVLGPYPSNHSPCTLSHDILSPPGVRT